MRERQWSDSDFAYPQFILFINQPEVMDVRQRSR